MRRSPLLTIFLIAFVGMLGYGIVIPITPFYAKEFGASDTTIGLLIGSYALMQFIFAPILGRLSDRVGRRPVLLVSLAGTIGSLLLFGFANSLVLLFVGRVLDGITGGNISIAQAYIADVTTEENRARGMGMIGAALGLGFIAGPALGGYLSRNGNYQLPIFVAAGVAAVSFVMTATMLPEPPRTAQRPAQTRTLDVVRLVRALGNPRIGVLLLITLLVGLAFTAFETTFALFVLRRLEYSSQETGYALAYIGIVVAIIQGGLIRRLAKAYGEAALIMAGASLLGLSLLVLGFIGATWELLAVGTVLAVGEGLITPALSSLISRRSLPEERGENLGMYQSMGSAARVIAPLTGAWLLDHVGLSVPYLIGGALVLAAAAIAMRFVRLETAELSGTARA
jgi:MFS transporter, DHA1 family, tetracycline resistance protein